jgi:hypothetical protein
MECAPVPSAEQTVPTSTLSIWSETYMKRVLLHLVVFIALILSSWPALAHVGSADVYYEGDAGPYHLFVTVKLPQVIPGIAEMQVRSATPDVQRIQTVLLRLTGPGSNLPSAPDFAQRSKDDPQFFVSNLWFMEYGALQVRIEADGAKGKASLAVPIASFPRQSLPMSPWLRVLGIGILVGLTLSIVPIIGGVVREATVPPGEVPQPSHRRRARSVMAFTLVATIGLLYANRTLWSAEAATYERSVELLKPRRVVTTIEDQNRLVLRLASPLMLPVAGRGKVTREIKMADVIPDHGHLMHLFLIGAPGMNRLWHLHPDRAGETFTQRLPAMPAGQYRVFAEIVDNNGFPWTLVGELTLPQLTGAAPAGDDSQWEGAPLSPASPEASAATLPDGARLIWEKPSTPLKANVPTSFRFRVESKDASPEPLEPYMGMAAHMIVMCSDLSVFAHLHPTGSVPMASLDMAQAGLFAQASAGAPSVSMGTMMHSQAQLPPNFSVPYGIPHPGQYRFVVQIKRSGQVQTAAFDTHVQ